MIIQRRLLGRVLELLPASRALLIEGLPRSGKTVFAGQIRRALGGETPMLEAFSSGAQALIDDPGTSLSSLLPRSTAALIIDNARAEDARRLARALESGGRGGAEPSFGPAPPPIILIGGPFGASLPAKAIGPGLPRLELRPFSLAELGGGSRSTHWLRGGLPESFLATSEREAFSWLQRYTLSLAEEGFGRTGLPWAPGRNRALLSMLAESQASSFNENEVARSLGVSRPTILRSLKALEEAGLIRFLPSLSSPAGRRRLRSPALYLRDSGLFHALLGIGSAEALLGSRRLAASWEAYGVEEALSVAAPGLEAARLPLASGPGLELVFLRGGKALEAAIFRFARGAEPGRGAGLALKELGLGRAWIVLPEAEERELSGGFSEIGLERFLGRVSKL